MSHPQTVAFGHRAEWQVAGTVSMQPAPMHRTIIFVDVEDFASRDRTNTDQAVVRAGLYRALVEAFAASGVPWAEVYHEDRGDGALILVSPEVPKNHLVTHLPSGLAAALTEHNRMIHRWQARIRLRMAIHAGEVISDNHGVAGAAINLTARLLEAKKLKRALRRSSDALALIASEWFFDDVIRHDPAGPPAAYQRVRVAVKKTKTTGWIRRTALPFPRSTLWAMQGNGNLNTRATPANVYIRDTFTDGPHGSSRGRER